MSLHRYAAPSAIADAEFHHNANRMTVALLHPARGAAPEKLAELRAALEQEKLLALPVYAERGAALQVSGFDTDAQLAGLLRDKGFVVGQPTVIEQPGDQVTVSSMDKLRGMGLKLAGMFNLVGNTGMVADGVKKRDAYRTVGGSLLTLGAANLVRYGNAKPEYYLQAAAEDLAGFIHSQGGKLPADSRLYTVLQHRREGGAAQVERFLYHHPAQVTLGVDAVGAGALLASGIKKVRDREGWGGLGFGIGSLGLKLVSMAVPEKSKEEGAQQGEAKTQVEKLTRFIQEKPLRFYGLGSMVSDVFLGVDAYQQYKKNPRGKQYVYTAVAGSSYMMADIMYAVSNKDHTNTDGKFTKDEQRALEAMAAEYVARQPEAARETQARRLGGFLAARKEMRGDAGSISKSIAQQAEHLRENPWASRVQDETARAPGR